MLNGNQELDSKIFQAVRIWKETKETKAGVYYKESQMSGVGVILKSVNNRSFCILNHPFQKIRIC